MKVLVITQNIDCNKKCIKHYARSIEMINNELFMTGVCTNVKDAMKFMSCKSNRKTLEKVAQKYDGGYVEEVECEDDTAGIQ